MKVIQLEVKSLINSSFIREEQHPDWVVNIVSVTRKMGRYEFALIYAI